MEEVHKDLYQVFWKDGLEPELILFLDGLNWLYIIMLIITFYGLRHTDFLDWLKSVLKSVKAKKYTHWLIAIVVGLLFMIFRCAEGNTITAIYLSSMLRSLVVTVIFSRIFVDIPVYIIKIIRSFVDSKAEAIKEKVSEIKD